MNGHFSEEALRHFAELAAQTQAADFSEGDTYDFTRCVRPDGSAYGTGGKCRKGTEGAKEIEEKAKRATGGPKKDAAKIVDGLYKSWDKAFMAFEDGESESTPGYAGETLAPKLAKALGLKLSPEQEQKLVSALDNASDRYQEDGAKGSFSRYAMAAIKGVTAKGGGSTKSPKPSKPKKANERLQTRMPEDALDTIEIFKKTKQLKKYVMPRGNVKIPRKDLEEILGWTQQDLDRISKATDRSKGGTIANEGSQEVVFHPWGVR